MTKLHQVTRRMMNAVCVMISLRLLDPGKWTDCPWFIEMVGQPGLVVNVSGLLRPWGGTGIFKGVKVVVFPGYSGTPDGFVTVSSGADSGFDCGARISDLMAGQYDSTNDIILATLSQLDFDNKGGKFHIAVNSGIGPGASLGTSASVQVGILRGLSNPRVAANRIAMLAVDAQLRKCQQPTGNQDQLAAAYASDKLPVTALRITIRNFPEAEVSGIAVGSEIRTAIESAGVITFIGSHSSGHEHGKARKRIESDRGLAVQAYAQMAGAAKATEIALHNDDVAAFASALDLTNMAHQLVHPDLIGITASGLMARARSYGAIGTMLPGAGGNGGSVMSLFGTHQEADTFVNATPQYRHYEIKLAG